MSLLEESRIIIPMQKMSHTNNLDLINIYAEYIMQNARLNEAQAGIKTDKRNINNLRNVDAFLEFSCFFDDPTDVGNLISGSSAFSKSA